MSWAGKDFDDLLKGPPTIGSRLANVEENGGRACLGHNSSRALQGLRVSDRQTETQGALKDWAHTARSVQDIFT